MKAGGFHQLFADRFTGPALKQDIVGQNDRGMAVRFQHGADMLDKVQLLVAGRHPEILPVVGQVFGVLLALIVGKGHAALLAEGRIGQHIIHPQAGIGNERIRR